MIFITTLLLLSLIATVICPSALGGGKRFTYSKTNLLKATLPFIIIFGHIYQHTGFGSDFYVSGIYCVGLFFFISGYGLEKKSTISIKHLTTRVAKVLLPLFVPICLYLTMQYCVFNKNINELVKASLAHYELIIPYSWFFITLIILYVAFFFCRMISTKNENLLIPILTASLFVMSALYLRFGLQGTYHISNFAFLAGVIMSKYEDKLLAKCRGTKGTLGLATLLLLSLFIALHPFKGSIYFNVFLYSFVAAIILSLMKDFTNRFVDFFKGMSFELYTCQGIAFLLIPYDGNQPVAFAIAVITLTIIFAWFSSRINHALVKTKRK